MSMPRKRHSRAITGLELCEKELPELIASISRGSQTAIDPRSFDGRPCALTIALSHPDRYRAPVPSRHRRPSEVPWGIKALSGYLGGRPKAWPSMTPSR